MILRVDNIACVYGFENGQAKGDETASIIIRGAKLIAGYLGTVLHVEHLPRRSCWEAELADNLTRERTTREMELAALSRFGPFHQPKVLADWMERPSADWQLALKLLDHVKNMME